MKKKTRIKKDQSLSDCWKPLLYKLQQFDLGNKLPLTPSEAELLENALIYLGVDVA